MVKIPEKILNDINMYINLIEQNNIHIQKVVLYGSYAKGTYNELSDIDLAIVSEDFEGIRILDKDKIRKFNIQINSDISPMTYRPEDFNEDNPFVLEILKYGIVLKN